MTMINAMTTALDTLMGAIKEDYTRWTSVGGKKEFSEWNLKMIAEFNDSLSYTVGKKYIKVVTKGSVWGFVVNTDNDKKFPKGTILKAAGWAAPARNFSRGNVLEGGYTVMWTGTA
jgi:hypothetical protein